MENNLKEKKKSLVNIFIILVATFLLSFLFIVFISYTRHIEYKNVLTNISTLSIPKIIDSSQVYQHATSLVYSTEKLNNSKTQASRRLIYATITKEIKQIKKLSNKLSSENSFLNNNLTVIQNELHQLNLHIENRLNIQKKIESRIEKLNDLHTKILSFYEKNHGNNIDNKIAINNWRIHFAEIVNLNYQSLSITRLNHLRQNISRQNSLLSLLTQDTRYINTKPFNILKTYLVKLKENHLNKEGLLNLRLEQLKTNGRTTGHGNFVNSLIYDFDNELENIAINYAQSVINSSKQSQKKAEEQIRLMILYFIVIFFASLLIMLYINKIIIKRLVKLNQNVQQRIEGEHTKLKDKRNDEISHISYSLNYFAQKVYEQNKQLEKLSLNDALTGISNRRAFDLKLKNEISLIKRNDYSMSLLMIDVDFFKLYNDNYGHQKGDECLQVIAKTIKSIVKRDLDLVARYGGEEFACILSNCNDNIAQQTAHNIVKAIQSLKIVHMQSKCSKYISVSIGLTSVTKEDNLHPKNIIINADKSLYKAKQNGRNQVVVYSSY